MLNLFLIFRYFNFLIFSYFHWEKHIMHHGAYLDDTKTCFRTYNRSLMDNFVIWKYDTIPFKIKHPVHNINMYCTDFWQLTFHAKLNIFEKTQIKNCSLHLYASFGTFCVQIGQLLAPQWVFKHSEEFRNRGHFPSKTANSRFSNILQRLTVPRIIDQC